MSSGSGRSGGQQEADVTKERENRAVKLMASGISPAEAMIQSGCNYAVGGRPYQRVYKRFSRRQKSVKKKAKTMQLASQTEKESTACELMLKNKTGPAEAMIQAGLCCVRQDFPIHSTVPLFFQTAITRQVDQITLECISVPGEKKNYRSTSS